MQQIELKNTGNYAIVDDDDYDYLNQWRWTEHKRRHTSYAKRNTNGGDVIIYMHRAVLNLNSKLDIADHINHNGLDNRRSNLRCGTNRDNSCNKRRNSNKFSSKYKGVYGSCGKFIARVSYKGKNINAETVETEEMAAIIYNKIATFILGEKCYLNIVNDYSFSDTHNNIIDTAVKNFHLKYSKINYVSNLIYHEWINNKCNLCGITRKRKTNIRNSNLVLTSRITYKDINGNHLKERPNCLPTTDIAAK